MMTGRGKKRIAKKPERRNEIKIEHWDEHRMDDAMKRRSGKATWMMAVAVAGLAVGGCYYPGGPLRSADRYTYESFAWSPKTVTVIDTRLGEAVWAVDVPVDTQLVMQFSRGTGPNDFEPDEIIWQIMRHGKRFGELKNRSPSPPADARRVEMTIRASPEDLGEHLDGSPFTPDDASSEPAPGTPGMSG